MNHLQQVVFCQWVKVLLLGVITFCVVFLAVKAANAHVMGHPEWDEWLAAQTTPDDHPRSCCWRADAFVLDDEDLRFSNGEIEARIPGEGWVTFPNTGQGNKGNTVLGTVGNPTGAPVAWVYNHRPYCISLGAMG